MQHAIPQPKEEKVAGQPQPASLRTRISQALEVPIANDSCVQHLVHPELKVDASEKAFWISCVNLLLTERLCVFWEVMHFCLKLIILQMLELAKGSVRR